MGLISEASTVYPQSYPQQLHGTVDGLVVLTDSPLAVDALRGRFEAAVSVIDPEDWIGWMSPWTDLKRVDIVLAPTQVHAAQACRAALKTGRAVRELEIVTPSGEHVTRFRIRDADYLERELARAAYEAAPEARHAAVRELTRRCASMVPLDYDVDEIVERIAAALPRSETGLVRPAIETALRDVRARAIGWRSVTGESHPHEVQVRALDEGLADEIAQARKTIWVLDTPTGSGKSELIEEIIDRLRASWKITCVAHRRSISQTYADQLPHYEALDVAPGREHTVPGLAVCVNSLAKPRIWEVVHGTSVLVLEEAAQIYRHLVTSDVRERELVFERLRELIAAADLVIAADADANDMLMHQLANAAGGKRLTRIHQPPSLSHLQANLGRYETLLEEAKNSAMAGVRTVIATDASPRTVEGLARKFEGKGRRVLVVTAESNGEPDAQRFLRDPDGTIRGEAYDVLIYTPAITSSISITREHFEAHYGLFSGVVTADDAVQMMRRDRTARTFRVGLKWPYQWQPEDMQSLLRRELQPSGRDPRNASALEHLCATVLAEENASRNSISGALWSVLEHQGVHVTRVEGEGEAMRAGHASRREALEVGRQAYDERILSVTPASTAEVRDQCPREGESRRDLDARLDRRLIERLFGSAHVGEAELAIWDGGALRSRLDNLAHARMSDAQARAADERERALPFVDRRDHGLRRTILQGLLQRLRLDLDADDHLGFDDAIAAATLQWLVESHFDDVRRLGLARLNRRAAETRKPTRVVKNLLRRLFGLQAEPDRNQHNGQRQRWYRIDEPQRTLMRRLLANHPGPAVAGVRGMFRGDGGASAMSDEEFASLCQWLDERR